MPKQFNRRQQVYERVYRKQFYNYLASVNSKAAKWIVENGLSVDIDAFLDYDRVLFIYRRLYTRLTLEEAKLAYVDLPKLKKKDILDILAGLLTAGSDDVPIGIWRRLLNDFLTIRIAGRITEVNSTTRLRLAFIIEDGISDGLGAEEVARNIRDDVNYNRNRSLAIARTETITAMNQGKYLAAQSSPWVMEKLWSPTVDARTRPSHLAMKVQPWRDLNDFFWLANDKGMLEQAQYPGDSTLSASNVVNCRCSLVTRAKKVNGRLIRK